MFYCEIMLHLHFFFQSSNAERYWIMINGIVLHVDNKHEFGPECQFT